MGTLRVYLAGKVCVERDDRLVPERRLPGGQGRLVFAYLAAEHERAVHRDELAEELWHGEPPRAWEAALRVVVSKPQCVCTRQRRQSQQPVKRAARRPTTRPLKRPMR